MALVRPAQSPIVLLVLALPTVQNAVATISLRVTPVQTNVQTIALLVKAVQVVARLVKLAISCRDHLVPGRAPLLAKLVALPRTLAHLVFSVNI